MKNQHKRRNDVNSTLTAAAVFCKINFYEASNSGEAIFMKDLKLHRFPNDLFPFHGYEILSGQILRAGQAPKVTSNFIDRITLLQWRRSGITWFPPIS